MILDHFFLSELRSFALEPAEKLLLSLGIKPRVAQMIGIRRGSCLDRSATYSDIPKTV